MTPRRVATVVVALGLVLAGCQGPAAAPTGTEPATTGGGTTAATAPGGTPTDADITVRNGSLPVAPDAVFARTQALLGTNATPPSYIEVVHDPDALAPGAERRLPRSWRLLGLRADGVDERRVERLENGVTTALGGIRLYLPGNVSAATAEWLLVHEFVHYIVIQRGLATPLARGLPRTTDAEVFVARALGEGVAVYATDAYIARYDLPTRPNAGRYRELRPAIADGSVAQYVNDAYIAGHRYVAARLETPAEVDAAFEDPPTTSEQLLHGYAPAAEPPSPLAVTATAPDGWRAVGRDTLGEAFIRAVLDRSLPRDRASRGAAGWGNDSLVVFRHPDRDNASYVWLLRWDDRRNATEFADAFRAQLESRGAGAGRDRWSVAGTAVEVRRPGGRTVAVVIGPTGFIDGIDVAVDGADVRIRPA